MTDAKHVEYPDRNQIQASQAGPYCVGNRNFQSLANPTSFAQQLDELRVAGDATWWREAAVALERAANNQTGRINQELCRELAHAILSGLDGILPRAFAAAAGLSTKTHARTSIRREVRAASYVLAKDYGYIVDSSPVKAC